MKKKSASVVTSEIVDYLLRLPQCFAYRSNTLGVPTSDGSFRSAPKRGVPDITGIYKSKAFYVEVKIDKDVMSSVQKSFMACVQASGGIFILATSFESFISQFQATFCD